MRFNFIGQIGIKATDLIKGLRIQWFSPYTRLWDNNLAVVPLLQIKIADVSILNYCLSNLLLEHSENIFFFQIVTIFLAKKWNIFAWVGSVWEVGWGIGTNQRDQIWRNFATLAKSSKFPAIFESSFGIWHTFKPILTNFVCLWADFHWCKWSKIEK